MDVLREFERLSAGARPRADCPDPERIWDASRGACRRDELGRLLDHSLDCGVCAESWRVASALQQAAPGSSSRHRVTRVVLAAGALAAALAAAVVLPLLLEPAERPPVVRDSVVQQIESLVAEDVPLPRDGLVLRWTAAPGSRSAIEVADEKLRVIARAEGLSSPAFTVPEAALAGLEPGQRVLWRVEVSTPGGETLRSRTFLATVGGSR